MKWMERFEAKVEVILSRWFLSASAPRPTAFANPWSPGAGPWRFGEHTVPALGSPAAASDPKPSTAKALGVTRLVRTAPARW